MEMYNVHQDALMLPVFLKTNDYVLDNEKLPAVSVSASKDKNGMTHISLVNIDAAKTQDISINVNGAKFTSVSGRIITSKRLQDYNSFDAPNKIHPEEFNDAKLSDSSLQVKLPPFSVVVLTLK
jgi:alpha-N-arabinofuranosidase